MCSSCLTNLIDRISIKNGGALPLQGSCALWCSRHWLLPQVTGTGRSSPTRDSELPVPSRGGAARRDHWQTQTSVMCSGRFGRKSGEEHRQWRNPRAEPEVGSATRGTGDLNVNPGRGNHPTAPTARALSASSLRLRAPASSARARVASGCRGLDPGRTRMHASWRQAAASREHRDPKAAA